MAEWMILHEDFRGDIRILRKKDLPTQRPEWAVASEDMFAPWTGKPTHFHRDDPVDPDRITGIHYWGESEKDALEMLLDAQAQQHGYLPEGGELDLSD